MPNPFYQIYEGAACSPTPSRSSSTTCPENDFGSDFGSIDEATLARHPARSRVLAWQSHRPAVDADEWKTLFELSDRYGFVIAADECYSEIYFDDADKPIGGLEAAWRLRAPTSATW